MYICSSSTKILHRRAQLASWINVTLSDRFHPFKPSDSQTDHILNFNIRNILRSYIGISIKSDGMGRYFSQRRV